MSRRTRSRTRRIAQYSAISGGSSSAATAALAGVVGLALLGASMVSRRSAPPTPVGDTATPAKKAKVG